MQRINELGQPELVCVVDDDAAVSASLCLLIETLGVRVRPYPSARLFLDDPCHRECACLVLDVRMPGMSGLELQSRLNASGWIAPILFITGHGDVPVAVQAIRGGAIDFLQKPFGDQVLLDRVQQALNHYGVMRREANERATLMARLSLLTPREREVMQLAVKGQMNKTIADALGISIKTVEDHRASIMKKMHACSFADLVRMAVEAERT